MTADDGDDRRWTIGELAEATGVTIRTLYHYDEIGLVTAGERTPAGHRRYTADDLRRLYRVRALRGLGLSLEEIADVLARPADDLTALRDLLGAQLAAAERRTVRLEQLKDRLGGLLRQLDRSVMPDAEQFMATLETLSVYDAYFAGDLRDHLARHRAELGADRLERVRAEWLELVREIRGHARAGTPVGDPRVQDLAARWQAMAAGLRIGDGERIGGGIREETGERIGERIRAAGEALWRDHGAQISQEVARDIDWLEPDDLPAVFAYLRRALDSTPASTPASAPDGAPEKDGE
ncbi:MAG TPA: MerR family transcriptional regulator [Nonomuraea sp.]|nr:MerR family transcriptional regulator [Nonomuraea sp.]